MLKIFRQSQLSLRPKSKKDEPKENLNLFLFPWKRWSGHTESFFEKHAKFIT